MHTLAFAVLIGLVVLTIAACSEGPAPVHHKPADEAALPPPIATASPSSKLPSGIPGLIDDSPRPNSAAQETATPTSLEEPVREVTLPEMERPVATPRPISVQDDQSATTMPPPPAPSSGPPLLEELEDRQAEGQLLEDRWRAREGLSPTTAQFYRAEFEALNAISLYVAGPLFPNHYRVSGVDECLELRVEPHPDAEVINCLPEETVVRHALVLDTLNNRNTWNKYGTRWRLLENPLNGYSADPTAIGWADDRYLRSSYKSQMDPPPTIHLDVEGPLPASHVRVTGTDECLDVRAVPNMDSQILHCLPEGFVAGHLPVDPDGVLEIKGVLWRLLRDPIHRDGRGSKPEPIGWADARYLEVGEGTHDEQELETIALDPIPHAEFPDDIALIYQVAPNIRLHWEGVGPAIPLLRAYKRNGVVTREVLFSLDQPGPQVIPLPNSDHDEENLKYYLPDQIDLITTPDGSRIIVAVCHWAACHPSFYGGAYYKEDPPSPHLTDLYESTDGGVTWGYLDTLPGLWRLLAASTGNAGDAPQVLLQGYQAPPSGGDDFYYYHSFSYVLSPSGDMGQYGHLRERIVGDHRPLPDYEELEVNQNREGQPFFIPALWLSDNEILGRERYLHIDLFGGAALGLYHFHPGQYVRRVMEDEVDWYSLWPWPTIHDVETGELHPLALPPEALRIGDWPYLLAVQHGPFLRVVDVGDSCLPIRAGASPDAEELDCTAERVLLQDQGGDVITDDGVTWRKVKTPLGVVGWANGRFLE